MNASCGLVAAAAAKGRLIPMAFVLFYVMSSGWSTPTEAWSLSAPVHAVDAYLCSKEGGMHVGFALDARRNDSRCALEFCSVAIRLLRAHLAMNDLAEDALVVKNAIMGLNAATGYCGALQIR